MKVYEMYIDERDLCLDEEGQLVLWIASNTEPTAPERSPIHSIHEISVDPKDAGVDLIV